MANVEIREGSELRAKARKYLEGLVRFTEGDLSDLTRLLEDAQWQNVRTRDVVTEEALREHAREYLAKGGQKVRFGTSETDVDALLALLVRVRESSRILPSAEHVRAIRIGEEARRFVAHSVTAPKLATFDAQFAAFSEFGEIVERRVRNEYEVTDGPEGSRSWRCARTIAMVREEREVLRAFIVDAAISRHESWTRALLAGHPGILDAPLTPNAEEHVCAGSKTALEEQVAVNADLVERNRGLSAQVEQLQAQLAGCGVAALGGTMDPATKEYQDVLDLRRDVDSFVLGIHRVLEKSALPPAVRDALNEYLARRETVGHAVDRMKPEGG